MTTDFTLSYTEEEKAQLQVIRDELDTWDGLTKYWKDLRSYCEQADWEGSLPHGWADFKEDFAVYLFEIIYHSDKG